MIRSDEVMCPSCCDRDSQSLGKTQQKILRTGESHPSTGKYDWSFCRCNQGEYLYRLSFKLGLIHFCIILGRVVGVHPLRIDHGSLNIHRYIQPNGPRPAVGSKVNRAGKVVANRFRINNRNGIFRYPPDHPYDVHLLIA